MYYKKNQTELKKIISIEKFDDSKILIDADDILPDYITLKIVIPLMASVIKDDDKFYLRLFLEKALYDE